MTGLGGGILPTFSWRREGKREEKILWVAGVDTGFVGDDNNHVFYLPQKAENLEKIMLECREHVAVIWCSKVFAKKTNMPLLAGMRLGACFLAFCFLLLKRAPCGASMCGDVIWPMACPNLSYKKGLYREVLLWKLTSIWRTARSLSILAPGANLVSGPSSATHQLLDPRKY